MEITAAHLTAPEASRRFPFLPPGSNNYSPGERRLVDIAQHTEMVEAELTRRIPSRKRGRG